jgi:hypothetical protein
VFYGEASGVAGKSREHTNAVKSYLPCIFLQKKFFSLTFSPNVIQVAKIIEHMNSDFGALL